MPNTDRPATNAVITNNTPDPRVGEIIRRSPELADLLTTSQSEASAIVTHAEKLPGIKLAPNSALFFFRDSGDDTSLLSKEEGTQRVQTRSVSIKGDTIRIIATFDTPQTHTEAPPVVIKSKAVADLLEGALDRALKDGLNPREAAQLEALRQEVTNRGIDGNFDKNDIAAIRTRAEHISPEEQGTSRTGSPRQGGNGRG